MTSCNVLVCGSLPWPYFPPWDLVTCIIMEMVVVVSWNRSPIAIHGIVLAIWDGSFIFEWSIRETKEHKMWSQWNQRWLLDFELTNVFIVTPYEFDMTLYRHTTPWTFIIMLHHGIEFLYNVDIRTHIRPLFPISSRMSRRWGHDIKFLVSHHLTCRRLCITPYYDLSELCWPPSHASHPCHPI